MFELSELVEKRVCVTLTKNMEYATEVFSSVEQWIPHITPLLRCVRYALPDQAFHGIPDTAWRFVDKWVRRNGKKDKQ